MVTHHLNLFSTFFFFFYFIINFLIFVIIPSILLLYLILTYKHGHYFAVQIDISYPAPASPTGDSSGDQSIINYWLLQD